MTKWKVCPVQGRQLLDVREEDIFGDFRLCNTYRGGGGYDKFPEIYRKRTGSDLQVGRQFVVQLYGCHLDCPYCYVTRDGVFGEYVEYSTVGLVREFYRSQQNVFHLMGGAPALYLEDWKHIVDILTEDAVFHSDLLLTEKEYKLEWLEPLARDNVLLAVNIKGTTPNNYIDNTGRVFDHELFFKNLKTLLNSKVSFYVTFTNPNEVGLNGFKDRIAYEFGDEVFEDSFVIDLIDYDALKVEE